MQNKFKSKAQKSQKTVTRKWVDKQGNVHVKTYVYGTKETGYIPGVARRAQLAKPKKKKPRPSKIESITRRARKSRESLFTERGTINQTVKQRLIYQVEHDKSLALDEKLMFRDWLKSNIKVLKVKYPTLSASSAIGLYESGNSTIQSLYNTGMSPEEIADMLNSSYDDENLTGIDLTTSSNWNGSIFTSPSGHRYRFEFKYNEAPFTRIS